MAKILIVDDVPTNRDLLATVIRYMGHEPIEAWNGQEALDLIRHESPALVICDVLMPVMDGYEMVRQLRNEPLHSDLPVIFHTAYYYQEREALELAQACGVSDVLPKPAEPGQIMRTVERALRASSQDTHHPVVEPSEFDREHLRLVTGKLLEKIEEIHKANERLTALVELNLEITSERGVQQLLDRVCDGARELFAARFACLTVRPTEKSGQLHISRSGFVAQEGSGSEDALLDRGLPGEVLQERRVRHLVTTAAEFPSLGLPSGHPPAKEFLLAPVSSLAGDYGWICVADKEGPEGFSPADEKLLGILAAQIGRVYEIGVLNSQIERHAAALEREIAERKMAQQRLSAQYGVARALVEAETLDEAFPFILHAICRELDFAGGTLWQVDERKHILRCLDAWCSPHEGAENFLATTRALTLPHGCGLAGRAWAIGRPVWFPNLANEPSFMRKQVAAGAGLRSAVALPIHVRGRVSGVIDFFRTSAQEADESTLDMLAGFGHQIGQFIERVEQHQRIVRLSRVYAVLSGINSAIVRIRDRQALFEEACRIAVEQGHFGLVWIGELASDGSVLPLASAGPPAHLAALVAAGGEGNGDPLVARAARRALPVFLNDLAGENEGQPGEALKHGYRSQAVLPLHVENAVVGLITFYARESGFFIGAEMDLLTGLARDISFALEYIDKQERLSYLAHHDALTGLANRPLLLDHLKQAMSFAERSQRQVAVLLLDLDGFKAVNDTLGHAAGDELLFEIARRLRTCVREGDTVARLGGDEFVVVLAGVGDESDTAAVAHKIITALAEPFAVGGTAVSTRSSIGATLFPRDGREPETLIKNADVAMYRAKEQGGSDLCFFSDDMQTRAKRRLSIESALRRALEQEEFTLHYQPKVDMLTGRVTGAEALLRWVTPDGRVISPVEFIPVAEESGLILPIGRWVLTTAIAQARSWQNAGLPAVGVAVNMSVRQFREANQAIRLAQELDASGLSSHWLEIEITESVMMDSFERAMDVLHAFREMGLKISLDDFGTGYSSLSYLKRLPIDVIKIDRAFVRDLTTDPDDAAIVQAIIGMAHNLNLRVVAEGVETEGQLDYLRARHCDETQGFLLSRPLTAEGFSAVLRADCILPPRPDLALH